MKQSFILGMALSFVTFASWAQSHVEYITPNIIRVQWRPDGTTADNQTGVCVYEAPQEVSAADAKIVWRIDERTGALSFVNATTGEVLIAEDPVQPYATEPSVQERIIYDEASAHVEETANGKVTVKDIIRRDTIGLSTRYFVNFNYADGERALYGLGAHMEDYMNLKGKTLYLTQHNLKAMVPFVISTRGYGILFDAGCAMKFSPNKVSDREGFTMQLEGAQELDYYVIMGRDMDEVIAGYHKLTGQVSLMPRYVFGYTQSKERYVSSQDLIQTLAEYRRRHVPIDMIVQDWNYWPQGWGYMKMNPKYYPDPRALADSIHAMNAKLMVSIWPNPQWCPEAEDFKARGYMLEHDVYDVFRAEARSHYWSYANDEFFSRGFDAWWCDSSEPLDGDWNQLPAPGPDGRAYGWDDHERRWHLNKDVLSEALGVERSSLYSLYHSRGIYENQRLASSEKRVVNLTRSTYAGQQRYGTIVWNGDTHASWASFKQQIPAGLNYMATGNPYWTVDAGSFFTRSDGRRWFYTGQFPEGVNGEAYREYYVRMLQWATFLPMMRSHGSDTPREIWRFGEPGTPYYDAILRMINLRYSLVPYIYSMAARQSLHDYTMARPLAFDFAQDAEVLDLKDEYLFGDLLVCPVTDPGVSSRRVYLPSGTSWIDYWTGNVCEGGRWIEADAPIGQLPLYVRAGSIIPTTAVAEYTTAQVGQPITLQIYPGRDASFTLYDDEGDSYRYEQGEYATIELQWNDRARTLSIGERHGSYRGMPSECTFVVKTPMGDKTVVYRGIAMLVDF